MCCRRGPMRLGKTTLAQRIVERRTRASAFTRHLGPVIAKAGDLAALLTNLEERDVCSFDDEIHRLSPAVEGSAVSGDARISRSTSSLARRKKDEMRSMIELEKIE